MIMVSNCIRCKKISCQSLKPINIFKLEHHRFEWNWESDNEVVTAQRNRTETSSADVVQCHAEDTQEHWFGFLSLFYTIPIFLSDLKLKPSLWKKKVCTMLDKVSATFPKVNRMVRMVFELAYYDIVIQRDCQRITSLLRPYIYIYIYPHEQDVTQGQFLNWIWRV